MPQSMRRDGWPLGRLPEEAEGFEALKELALFPEGRWLFPEGRWLWCSQG